ncbi:major facilitator superfamily domain-containing protein [Roridomyces roridus]|uniref:Major facilitator superfamily domain-containing protein n=1 Tax=Roridomyces roridus TaxID=1738132 RepID=A0AAD7FAF4_9AGAR|nr:major facilitator superfamily domain-containing protein [Roridomyces roridus]
MATPSERDPLLTNAVDAGKRRLGPLEISAPNRYGILAGVWLGTFLASLNQSLVPTMMPSISSEFKKFHQASWLGTAYLLATCTFTPLYGRLCNAMGRKGANNTAMLFAALGTVVCGLSGDMNTLILARFIAGIGGGGLNTTSTIIVSDMYTLRDRGLVQGFASCINGLGMGLGGPFGGFITDWLGWRAAFLIQIPLFALAFILTSYNIRYVTPGKSKSPKDVLKRIDYLGSITLLISVLSLLVFLSTRYNEALPWSDFRVFVPLILGITFSLGFLFVEIYVAPEPVLAPFLLRQKVPVLVSASNFLVAACNFSVTYFYPMWFQVVTLESAATAGLHLMPNSISMSTGSVFAGWVMHRTGRYKKLNLIFGIFPFVGAVLISLMNPDSGPVQSWLSIIPLGFGNAVVLQTMLIALLANLPESHMAVGTGFGQLFRGIGQVGGVAISSAIFQTKLDSVLRERIHTPDAAELIQKIRTSSDVIRTLEPAVQQAARDSYADGLRAVYIFAASSTFLAYLVRLPIPDQDLDTAHPRARRRTTGQAPSVPIGNASVNEAPPPVPGDAVVAEPEPESESDAESDATPVPTPTPTSRPRRRPMRRLSTFESPDGIMDLESDHVGGSARSPPPPYTSVRPMSV